MNMPFLEQWVPSLYMAAK